jgi:16S rRNA (guanine527-N7)-methyltransferase
MFHVEQAWREAFVADAKTLQIPLSPAQIDQFQIYFHELLHWNEKVNLTSITNEREVVVKHFLDSMVVHRVLRAGPLLDVGSGAGFPGLPLKIFNPARPITLLEPNGKKTAFLRHLIGTLRLSGISVVPQRVQDLAARPRSQWPVSRFANIVTRALAVIPLLPHIQPLLADGGQLIWCRAQPMDVGLENKGFAVANEIEYALPGAFGNRVLTVLRTT